VQEKHRKKTLCCVKEPQQLVVSIHFQNIFAQNPITSAIIRVLNLSSLVLPWVPHPHGKRPDGHVSPEMSLKRTSYMLYNIHLEEPSTSMRCFFNLLTCRVSSDEMNDEMNDE